MRKILVILAVLLLGAMAFAYDGAYTQDEAAQIFTALNSLQKCTCGQDLSSYQSAFISCYSVDKTTRETREDCIALEEIGNEECSTNNMGNCPNELNSVMQLYTSLETKYSGGDSCAVYKTNQPVTGEARTEIQRMTANETKLGQYLNCVAGETVSNDITKFYSLSLKCASLQECSNEECMQLANMTATLFGNNALMDLYQKIQENAYNSTVQQKCYSIINPAAVTATDTTKPPVNTDTTPVTTTTTTDNTKPTTVTTTDTKPTTTDTTKTETKDSTKEKADEEESKSTKSSSSTSCMPQVIALLGLAGLGVFIFRKN